MLKAGRDAVVIGIDAYAGAPLRGCVSDAREMATTLALDQYAFAVRTLFDSQATRKRMLEALAELAFATEERDTLLIYFAGHGASVAGAGYLVAFDAEGFDPGVSFAHLAQIMESASKKYRHVVAILDCCHAGSAFTWTNSRPVAAADIDRDVVAVNESRSVLAACRPEQSAMEAGAEGGYFTTALIAGMTGDAVDFSGDVTLLGLHEYVARTLPEALQTPVFKGDVAGTVVLGGGFPARIGAPIPDAEKQATLAKAHGLLDSYSQLEIREYHDRARRLDGGSAECARELSGVVEWFESTRIALPQVEAEEAWREFRRRVAGHRRNLSEIQIGEVTRFGRVVRHIGNGGYGNVWEIADPDEPKSLAYKIYHGNELDDRTKVLRFQNGFANMRKLQHPHIVRVHDLTLAPFGFTMDSIPGSNLRDLYIDRESVQAALRLMIEIAETVSHAHGRGVLHRDIKPENIIVEIGESGSWTPYLTDFDLAYHETNRTVTTNLGVGGVINYAAPEQLYEPHAGSARAATVDIYSLAQLLFYVLTDRDPAGDNSQANQAHLNEVLRDWVDDRAAKIIRDLYEAATRKKPLDRIQTVREFIDALTRAEARVLVASGSGAVSEEDFCRRIATMYAGFDGFEASEFRASFASVSGGVAIEIREVGVARNGSVDIEVELNVREKLSVPGFKSGADARASTNARLDKMLVKFGAQRRPGRSGAYQVFIDVRRVSLDIDGAARVADLVRTAVGGIEQW